MKLVSRFEAASRSTAELHALLAEAFNAFANAPRSSQERHDALVTMRNIEDELSARARSLTVQRLAGCILGNRPQKRPKIRPFDCFQRS